MIGLWVPGVGQYSMRAFADALDWVGGCRRGSNDWWRFPSCNALFAYLLHLTVQVPLSLAENSGLPPIESLTEVRACAGLRAVWLCLEVAVVVVVEGWNGGSCGLPAWRAAPAVRCCNLWGNRPCTQTRSSPSSLTCFRTIRQVKTRQMKEDNPFLGIDCNDVGTHDMREQNVFETLAGKKQQLMLATQVCKMILKVSQDNEPQSVSLSQ